MSKLPTITSLIRDSWTAFLTHWKKTLDITIWFLAPPVMLLAVTLVMKANLNEGLTIFAILLFAIFCIYILVRTQIRLMDLLCDLDAGHKEPRTKQTSFWAFLWVSLLAGVAVMLGSVALVIPGIFLAVALSFSKLSLIEDGLGGTKALSASLDLVKGRWFETALRIVLAGGFCYLVTIVASDFLIFVFALIFGETTIASMTANPEIGTFASALLYLLQSIVYVVFMPLLVIWQVKLFHALKKTPQAKM